jgi:hypothetical protein
MQRTTGEKEYANCPDYKAGGNSYRYLYLTIEKAVLLLAVGRANSQPFK